MSQKIKRPSIFVPERFTLSDGENGHEDDRAYAVTLLAFVALMIVPIWFHLGGLPEWWDQDAQKSLASIHTISDAIRKYHEYPLWNPYFGGGVPWAGYVLNPGVSLQSLLYIAFGEVVGVKLWLFVIMLLGSYGMYGTARGWLGLKPQSAIAGSLFYATSPWLAGELDSADYDTMGYFLLPFVTLCMLRLLQRRWLGFLLPLCYATTLADNAKWWTFIIAGIVLLVSLSYRSQCGRPFKTVIGLWALTLGIGLALAAPKLLPLLDLMSADLVDQAKEQEWIGYESFGEIFAYAFGFRGLSAHGFVAGTNILQISPGAGGIFFALCGVILDWRRSLGLLGILSVALIFSLGPASPIPVVAIMSRLPLLNMMGSYGMYASLAILFCLCGIAAIGFEKLRQRAASRYGWPIDGLIMGSFAVALLYSASLTMLAYSTLFPLPDFSVSRQAFHHVSYKDNIGVVSRYRLLPDELLPDEFLEANQYFNVRRGLGTITWYGNMVFPEHALAKVVVDADGTTTVQDGYRGEVYCTSPAGSTCAVDGLKITYNTIRFHVSASEPSTVVLNFNYHKGWSSQMAEVTSHKGLLAARVTAATNEDIVLVFSDRRFAIGLFIAFAAATLWCFASLKLLGSTPVPNR